METTHYEKELEKLSNTYGAAMSADVTQLKAAIAGASESSIIGVGSGGSFTVASLLCNLHEAYTGRVSRPSTPLEIICNPTLAAASPVFLISAEGKNPDITEALQRARLHSARTVHVLTNHADSSLTRSTEDLTDVTLHTFQASEKDGYLATNSMLMNSVVIARAYGELDHAQDLFPKDLVDVRIGDQRIEQWVANAKTFAIEAVGRGALTIVYSPLLRPIAEDLESKLSEAALLHCQLADLRSYAHGRHLWLADRPQDCAVLALTERSLGRLWDSMKAHFPPTVPTLTMPLESASPRDLIAGLVAGMHLVASIARALGKDPGRPSVPQFGRELYYADLASVIPAPTEASDGLEQSKYEVLGARWPSARNHGSMRRARDAFCAAIQKQRFRAIVFDYDGTLCSAQRSNSHPPQTVLDRLERLVRSGIVVGIASGRGGSIQEHLRDHLPEDVQKKIQLGLYNGGWIADAAIPPTPKNETSEFLSHVTRIVVRLKGLGVPIQEFRATHPYQVSVRFPEGLSTENMWFVIADALRQAGLDLGSMVRSKHSVDILAAGVSKSLLIAHVIQTCKIDPYEILTIGDQGAWPGNDSSLLEHRFSISVDIPSRRMDRGWKLAPSYKRDVDATLWYLDHITAVGDGAFNISLGNTPAPETV
jgi:HAD superfamily hydrolase (TIGR01484 family)